MFNRSLKYILLLFVNIVVLLALYLNQAPKEVGVFDTQFVIDLLEERDDLQERVIDIESTESSRNEQIDRLQNRVKSLTEYQEELNGDFLICESNRILAQALVREQAAELNVVTSTEITPANCDSQNARIRLARQELANAQVQLEQQTELVKELRSELANADEQNDRRDMERTIESLKEQVAQLRADIENPIYLKSVYISGRKCQTPQFDELVCLQEVLVRPQFSKAPTSDVVVTVYTPNDRVLASASFESKRAQLFRFPLGRGQEVLAGEFRATFEVEDETLSTDGHIITQ